MGMYSMEETILCGASAYSQKFYINEEFAGLPQQIKDELRILCVLFTEDVGGVFHMVFDEEGTLQLRTGSDEGDLLYDDIGSVLKVKQIQSDRRELMEQLELFYKVMREI